MRKILKGFWLIAALLMISIGIWYFFLRAPGNHSGTEYSVKRNEPAFNKEGVLYFLSPSKEDTISVLDIEISEKPNELTQGLMYRSHLGTNEGMLFIFNNEEKQSFWMKNTRISLDIIFVNSNMKIVQIARHTVPYSEEPVPSIYPARYVIEVNAGYTIRYGIKEGYYMTYIPEEMLSLYINKPEK